MKGIPGLVVVGAVLLLGASDARAQTPGRDGDTWGGFRHAPTEAQLRQEKSAAAVAASGSKEASETATVGQIYRQLMGLEHPPA